MVYTAHDSSNGSRRVILTKFKKLHEPQADAGICRSIVCPSHAAPQLKMAMALSSNEHDAFAVMQRMRTWPSIGSICKYADAWKHH